MIHHSILYKIELDKDDYKVLTKRRDTCRHIEEDLLYPMVYTLSNCVEHRWFRYMAPHVLWLVRAIQVIFRKHRCPTQFDKVYTIG